MHQVFTLSGSVATATGERVRDLRVAVVARGLLADTLLGAGDTDPLGEFRISFSRRELDLHRPLLRRGAPELHIIFSIHQDGDVIPLHDYVPEIDLPQDPICDLGEIQLPQVDAPRGRRAGRTREPDFTQGATRLDLDEELVGHCLREVAPKVEHLTGWRNLLDDLDIVVTNDYRKSFFRLLEWVDISIGIVARLFLRSWFKLILSQYEPLSQALIVNKRPCANCNLDGLKVVLGHELAHVGQFRSTPELADHCRDSLLWLKERMVQGDLSLKEIVERLDYSMTQYYMSQIEGYASYIESYLRQYYNCSMIVAPRSWLLSLLLHLPGGLSKDVEGLIGLKTKQYQAGEGFKGLEDGQSMAPFEP